MKIIGIDLGTTNSVVSVMEGTTPKILENERGGRVTPSAVWYKEDQVIVGELAKNNEFDSNVITSAKRFIGTEKTFELENGQNFTPEEVSTQIIKKLKEVAETKTGEKIQKAVITVPAYFGQAEREATMNAAKNAGLEVSRLINEPTAAALAHGFKDSEDKNIIVYDLGGGTFDVTVLEIASGNFEVKSTDGDKNLGGDDFDNVIVQEILDDINENHGIDLNGDEKAIKRIKQVAETIKKELSNLEVANINIPMLTFTKNGPFNYDSNFTRKKFEELIKSFVEKTIRIMSDAITESGLDKKEISEVILVGGSTRVPMVKAAIKNEFSIPINESSNPDEVVSIGAAIQGGVLSGDVADILLLDVTSLDMGIATGMDRKMSTIIERNTTIPTFGKSSYTTLHDGQTSVEIEIYQGNHEYVDDNFAMESFEFDNIEPEPAGMAQIEVTFKYDSNMMLSVEVENMKTGYKIEKKVKQVTTLTK